MNQATAAADAAQGLPLSASSPSAATTSDRLVLASASPRRQELLHEAGYRFIVDPAHIDEDSVDNLMPMELAVFLAEQKARAVAPRHPKQVVLAADTVVAFGDQPLGKPEDAAEARQMLQLLSGTTHIVITGISALCLQQNLHHSSASLSAVRMRPLNEQEIERYVQSGLWRGKAGGYGIQDPDPFVIRMSGSLSNIVGLPMEITGELLARLGVYPAAGGASAA